MRQARRFFVLFGIRRCTRGDDMIPSLPSSRRGNQVKNKRRICSPKRPTLMKVVCHSVVEIRVVRVVR